VRGVAGGSRHWVWISVHDEELVVDLVHGQLRQLGERLG